MGVCKYVCIKIWMIWELSHRFDSRAAHHCLLLTLWPTKRYALVWGLKFHTIRHESREPDATTQAMFTRMTSTSTTKCTDKLDMCICMYAATCQNICGLQKQIPCLAMSIKLTLSLLITNIKLPAWYLLHEWKDIQDCCNNNLLYASYCTKHECSPLSLWWGF